MASYCDFAPGRSFPVSRNTINIESVGSARKLSRFLDSQPHKPA